MLQHRHDEYVVANPFKYPNPSHIHRINIPISSKKRETKEHFDIRRTEASKSKAIRLVIQRGQAESRRIFFWFFKGEKKT